MNNLLSQLKVFELTLLICGVVFFVVLLIILIGKATRDKPFAGLLLFFVFPILMIGYPSIKSVKVSKDQIEIVTKTEEVESDPSDSIATKQLELLLKKVDFERMKDNPKALKEIANAESALGNYDTALKIIDKAIAIDRSNTDILKLKSTIAVKQREEVEFKNKIEQLQNIVKNNNQADASKATRVAEILLDMKPPVYIDKKSSLTLAHSFALVNEKEKALETVNKITAIQPANVEAITIEKNLAMDSIDGDTARVTRQLHNELRRSAIFNASSRELVVKEVK